MNSNSLRSRRYVFYTLLLVLIMMDVISVHYFSRLLYVNNEYMNSNKYELVKNIRDIIINYSNEYSDPGIMIKIKQHELRDFLNLSNVDEFCIMNDDLEILLKSEYFEYSKSMYLTIKRVKSQNLDTRHYLNDYDTYYLGINSKKEDIYVIMMFKTDLAVIQYKLRLYFIFKIVIFICVIIVGVLLVRALEDPLKNISYIAKKLGLDINSDNPEEITRIFKNSIEGIAEMNEEQKNQVQTIQERLRGEESRIVRKEGLLQLSSMSSGLAHQINNNLASIKGILGIAKNKKDLTKIPIIENEIDRLIMLTDKFMKFSNSNEIYKQSFDIINLINKQALKSQLTLKMYDSPSKLNIISDLLIWEEILFNIFDNIFHYAENDDVYCEVKELPGNIMIKFKDIGPGLPQEIIDNPYKPFAESAKGYGLGIPTVMKLLSLLDAELKMANYLNGVELTININNNEKNTDN